MRLLIEQLISGLFLLRIVRKFKNRTSLIKIRAVQAYVLGVKKTRIFFLGGLFVSISFVFLINGISLIQMAVFTYSQWSNETKFIVALVLGGFEFLLAMGIFIFLFREETWSQFYGIKAVVDSVIKEEHDEDFTGQS